MTEHFKHIYTHQAAQYHQLITPEDVDGNLLPALERITSLKDKTMLDLGCGTGRLSLLLGKQVKQIIGLDLHTGMLQQNKKQQKKRGKQWPLLQGDMRILPFADKWADVVTAGWAIGHFTNWYQDDWQKQIGYVLNEMHRVVKPQGAIIILETLTTGSLTPVPPTPGLADYYQWLEENWGFKRQTIQTDYQFESVEKAIEYTEFFFGPALSAKIKEHGWSRLPEWTGVWDKTTSKL